MGGRRRSGVLIWGGIFFVPLFVQEVNGVSPTAAGFTLMPLMFGAAAGTLVAGRAVERSGRIRSWPIGGSVLMVIGIALLATIGLATPTAVVGAWAAPVGDLGTATSAVLLCRSLGSTIGIPIFGGILNAGLAARGMGSAGFAHAVPLVFLAGVPVALASVVLALRLEDRPLRTETVIAERAAPQGS